MNAPVNTSFADRKPLLEARLSDLQARLVAIEAELEQHHDPDWEELAVQREGDEVLEASGLSAQQEIRMIRSALTRMTQGSYGICAHCGDPIGEARLNAVPFTPFCPACAAAKDRKAGAQ
jgi:RNA polymerase-binding transcription factor DksA